MFLRIKVLSISFIPTDLLRMLGSSGASFILTLKIKCESNLLWLECEVVSPKHKFLFVFVDMSNSKPSLIIKLCEILLLLVFIVSNNLDLTSLS
jgi:hypothetical protein